MISIDYNILQKAISEVFKSSKIAECDAGAAAGAASGDAGSGAAGAAGDASGDIGNSASEIATSGTSSTSVLGHCDHSSDGYLGAGCFHVPSKCAFPFHRWEIGNGGSKRKKNKKGKTKRYAYEKGMKVVYDMLHEDDISKVKVPKKLMAARLKKIARAIKTMNDVNIAERKFEAEGPAKASMIPVKFNKAKEAFLDIGAFLKDICKGNYKASWFTISLLAVAIVYVLSPVDLISDLIPGLGQIDDAMVIMWVFNALKGEFEQWQAWKSQINVKDELDNAFDVQRKNTSVNEMAKQLAERKCQDLKLEQSN